MRNRYVEPLSFDHAPAWSDVLPPIASKVPLIRNSAMPMLAPLGRPWIV
jgi:hypothetical protein